MNGPIFDMPRFGLRDECDAGCSSALLPREERGLFLLSRRFNPGDATRCMRLDFARNYFAFNPHWPLV